MVDIWYAIDCEVTTLRIVGSKGSVRNQVFYMIDRSPIVSQIRRVSISIALLTLILVAGCSSSFPPTPPMTVTLPGQELWKNNISSLLFGTNDTYEFSSKNIQTESSIQQAIRAAGFTLIRSFFPDKASDAEIEKRIVTIEQSGAHCLGVITNIFNTTFDEHLVQYLGQRCNLYEFGNESDYNGVPINSYLQQWNASIPKLRAINPQAKFIGPVTHDQSGVNEYMRAFLEGVRQSRVLPDAVSFHWYPCYLYTQQACLNEASSVGDAVQYVRSLVVGTLGKELPIGVTEWNYDPSNPPPAYGEDTAFIQQFTKDALQAMVQAGVAIACQFDAASFAGYGRLDMFNVANAQPKPQYYAIKDLIQQYRPSSSS